MFFSDGKVGFIRSQAKPQWIYASACWLTLQTEGIRKTLWQKAMRLYRTEFPLGWKADWHSSELSAVCCFGETVFSEMASGFRFTVLGPVIAFVIYPQDRLYH